MSLTINHPAIVLLAMFLHAAERRGVPWAALRGTVQNDSLKEFHGQKTFALPPAPALKLTTDVIEFATQHAPNWYIVSISGYHTREAGADAVQELAFTHRPGDGLCGIGAGTGAAGGRLRAAPVPLFRGA